MMTINCPDCDVQPGQIHNPGCDQERCTVCGRQYLVCECAEHNHDLAIWKPVTFIFTHKQAKKLYNVVMSYEDEGPGSEGWQSAELAGIVCNIRETLEIYEHANKSLHTTPKDGRKN